MGDDDRRDLAAAALAMVQEQVRRSVPASPVVDAADVERIIDDARNRERLNFRLSEIERRLDAVDVALDPVLADRNDAGAVRRFFGRNWKRLALAVSLVGGIVAIAVGLDRLMSHADIPDDADTALASDSEYDDDALVGPGR